MSFTRLVDYLNFNKLKTRLRVPPVFLKTGNV